MAEFKVLSLYGEHEHTMINFLFIREFENALQSPSPSEFSSWTVRPHYANQMSWNNRELEFNFEVPYCIFLTRVVIEASSLF